MEEQHIRKMGDCRFYLAKMVAESFGSNFGGSYDVAHSEIATRVAERGKTDLISHFNDQLVCLYDRGGKLRVSILDSKYDAAVKDVLTGCGFGYAPLRVSENSVELDIYPTAGTVKERCPAAGAIDEGPCTPDKWYDLVNAPFAKAFPERPCTPYEFNYLATVPVNEVVKESYPVGNAMPERPCELVEVHDLVFDPPLYIDLPRGPHPTLEDYASLMDSMVMLAKSIKAMRYDSSNQNMKKLVDVFK